MENTIIFQINKCDSIKIILPCLNEELTFCHDVKIVAVINSKEYVLYNYDTILWALRCLSASLESALNHKLDISFLSNDIGYIYNQKIYATANQSESTISHLDEWNDDCLIWNFKEFALWIYNKDSSIFFEITPVFQWHFSKPETNETYISYETFMLEYKSIATIEINKDTAEKLLKQSEDLLNSIQT